MMCGLCLCFCIFPSIIKLITTSFSFLYRFIPLLRNCQQLGSTTFFSVKSDLSCQQLTSIGNNTMQKLSNNNSVQIQTMGSTIMIPPEESAENNLSEQLKIVRLWKEILRMETLKLKRMLRERLLDREKEGSFGKKINWKK